MTPPQPLTPLAKLKRNIRDICRRIARGQAAQGNWQVQWQLALRIASILLSSLGSVGVIADKASGNLPGETGWAFWGSVILLTFGILSQIANEFQIAQAASDSRSLADRCALYQTQLENMLLQENPTKAVGELLQALNGFLETERFHRVLPSTTPYLIAEADRIAEQLVRDHENYWQLKPSRRLPPGGLTRD